MTQLQLIQAELESWEAETGQPLPMPAAEIARIEMTGRSVDLCTGEIVNPRVCIQTHIEIAGEDAGKVARCLETVIDAGSLDLAIVTMLRAELRGVAGDWRIVAADGSAAEVTP
jgi:hypothetical protein